LKEKLIIRNFGPIKNVELELSRFNVLIGENGTGKSTVAKVLGSIHNIFFNLKEHDRAILIANNFSIDKTELFTRSLSSYEIDNYSNSESFIDFHSEDLNFICNNGTVDFEYKKLLGKSLTPNGEVTYIPADRIATSLFSTATWPGLIDVEEGRIDMPKYFLRFINLFERLKKARDEFDFTEILGIKFRQDDGIDKIILKDGTIIGINKSASAIQSNLSLSVIIDHQAENNSTKKTFIIEEPELNLFPAAQNKLMQYLVDKIMNYKNQLLITTHSPYILTSLNNLMYAYSVGKRYNDEADKIIEKKYWVNPDDVSVYMLSSNGECEDIFDREEGLIKAEEIDGVTNTLNEQFSSLLNLQFVANESNT